MITETVERSRGVRNRGKPVPVARMAPSREYLLWLDQAGHETPSSTAVPTIKKTEGLSREDQSPHVASHRQNCHGQQRRERRPPTARGSGRPIRSAGRCPLVSDLIPSAAN